MTCHLHVGFVVLLVVVEVLLMVPSVPTKHPHIIRQRDRPMFLESVKAPVKPKTFTNSDDLAVYLQALAKYYSVIGKPRFGRSVADDMAHPAGGRIRTA